MFRRIPVCLIPFAVFSAFSISVLLSSCGRLNESSSVSFSLSYEAVEKIFDGGGRSSSKAFRALIGESEYTLEISVSGEDISFSNSYTIKEPETENGGKNPQVFTIDELPSEIFVSVNVSVFRGGKPLWKTKNVPTILLLPGDNLVNIQMIKAETPKNPENPENPSDPENPENPSEPENPSDPENPETPENPSLPSSSGSIKITAEDDLEVLLSGTKAGAEDMSLSTSGETVYSISVSDVDGNAVDLESANTEVALYNGGVKYADTSVQATVSAKNTITISGAVAPGSYQLLVTFSHNGKTYQVTFDLSAKETL